MEKVFLDVTLVVIVCTKRVTVDVALAILYCVSAPFGGPLVPNHRYHNGLFPNRIRTHVQMHRDLQGL